MFKFLIAILILGGCCASPVFCEENDILVAYKVAREYQLTPYLFKIMLAVRFAENGRAGFEYGVIAAKNTNQLEQARWCAGTIKKNYERWIKTGMQGSFLEFLANKYCPVGAENDPNGLNRHWIKNVKTFLQSIDGEEK